MACHRNELSLPPVAESDDSAVELLRVWACPRKPQQFRIRTAYRDPAAWGLLLVDIVRHLGNAYQQEQGQQPDEVIRRIRQAVEAEWDRPTSDADPISN
jgi:hypothetical protein